MLWPPKAFQGVGAGEALTPLGLTPKMPSLSPVVRDSLLLVNCKSSDILSSLMVAPLVSQQFGLYRLNCGVGALI